MNNYKTNVKKMWFSDLKLVLFDITVKASNGVAWAGINRSGLDGLLLDTHLDIFGLIFLFKIFLRFFDFFVVF